MKRMRISMITKVSIAVITLGILFTLLFLQFVVNLFAESSREMHMAELTDLADAACDQMDSLADRFRLLAMNCADLKALTTGDREKIEATLENFAATNSEWVEFAYFVDTQDNVYCSSPLKLSVLQRTMQYDRPSQVAAEHGASPVVSFTEPYRSSMMTATTVAVCCTVYRGDGRGLTRVGDVVGTVILEINLNALGENMKQTVMLRGMHFMLVSGQNRLMFSNPEHSFEYRWDETLLERMIGAPAGWSTLEDCAGKPYWACRCESPYTGWAMVVLMDESTTFQSISELTHYTIRNSVILFVVLTLTMIALMSHFLRTIRRLAEEMRAVQACTTVPRHVPLERNDEVGDLSRNYARMLDRIRSLMEEQTNLERQRHEAELSVFQSQINPHFLYNTLNCIGALVQQGTAEKVPQAISALIRLLALSMDKTEKMIPLETEAACLSGYLDILSMRYGEKFSLTVMIDPELEECLVPKLLLQPIVENAVFHGILPSMRKGMIVVRAERRGGDLLITVTDDGVGIPQEKIRRLLSQPVTKDSDEGKFRFRSIGLYNTLNRIRLAFGEGYGIQIHSAESVGTCVEIRLPYIGKQNEEETL